ncbi:MAG: hypothetical protein WD066_11725 [Planctomycetaceae bacterium]
MSRFAVGVVALMMVSAGLGGSSAAYGQGLDLTKEVTVKGKISIGDHSLPLENGKVYQVRVEGFGFQPNVEIRPGYFANMDRQDQGDTMLGYFVPQETRTHRLFILPSLYEDFDQGALDYDLKITPITMAKDPLLDQKGALTAQSPLYDSPHVFSKDRRHKAFPVQLKSRQLYIIEMKADDDQDAFDPLLYLESPGGMIAAQDDDSGGDLNPRVFFLCRRDGEYRIIATCSETETGDFTITVRTQASE